MIPTDPPPNTELPPRVRRILELVYQVEGVAGARVWQWSGKIAIGVRPTPTSSATTVLHRVQTALAPLREAEEQWEFGVLEGD
jgi:hypothetical protein